MDNVLFRCSELHNLLTDPRKKDEDLSVGTKTYLKEVFIAEKYNRYKEIDSKYLDKGNECEDDSLTLLGEVTNRFLLKNTERKNNEYITGEWDTVSGDVVIDVKTSWDIFTFSNAIPKKEYIAQLNGYMWLLGLEKAELAYCLVDHTESTINGLWIKESYKTDTIDLSDQRRYQIAKNHIYTQDYFDVMKSAYFPKADTSDFITLSKVERIKTFEIQRDEKLIEKLKTRIELSREYLKTLTL